MEAIGKWAAEHGIWVVTDEIYEHLVYDGVKAESLPVVVPEIADTTLILNGVAKTYCHDGLAGRLDDRPSGRHQGRHQLPVAPVGNVANVSQRAALAAVSGDLDVVEEMREAFDVAAGRSWTMLSAIPGRRLPHPRGRVLRLPLGEGVLGKNIRGQRPPTPLNWPRSDPREAEVAVVPGEAFGTHGYLRLSYAMGDDDLVEGVRRIADLLAQ